MTCKHGFRHVECAICEKRPGECDFGACTRKADATLVQREESRRMCLPHARRAAYLYGGSAEPDLAPGEADARMTEERARA